MTPAVVPSAIRPLGRRFFARPALVVAPALLGRMLVHDSPRGRVAGRIVEVEAYRGSRDPASHAYRGRTARNAVMFGPPGHAYVYFTYGMHHCLNVVVAREGVAEAVLLRAVEPLEGLPVMMRRRRTCDLRALTRGPGRLAQALGIDRRHNGLDLTCGPLWIAAHSRPPAGLRKGRSARIGIRRAADRPWRFFHRSSPWVSVDGGVPRGPDPGVRVRR